MLVPPVNIQEWLKDNEHLLQPPVGNYCIQRGGSTVMIVGGPNQRTDYHINPTPEWFFQYKGPMTLKVVDEGEFKDITITEGSIFLLPANVPHSPCRYENTVGIVVEQDRPKGDLDRIRWYCGGCKEIVHETSLQMVDLGSQVKEAIVEFEGSLDARTCRKCGFINVSRPATLAAAPRA